MDILTITFKRISNHRQAVSKDMKGHLPYEVIERMMAFATPHDGDAIFNYKSGLSLSRAARGRLPRSPVVESHGVYPESRAMFHVFDRSFAYLPVVTKEDLMALTLMGKHNACLVLSFPIENAWFSRKKSLKTAAYQLLDEKRPPSFGQPIVGLVKTKKGMYAIARGTNYVPSESANNQGLNLAVCVGVVQRLSDNPGFLYWLSVNHHENDSLKRLSDLIEPVFGKDFQSIASYFLRGSRGKGGRGQSDLCSILLNSLNELRKCENGDREWWVQSSRYASDPSLDVT